MPSTEQSSTAPATARPVPVVLIIDDDLEWRDFLCTALGDRYLLLVATGGQRGLDIATRLGPDIILLDVVMPGGMNGFATFLELRKEPATHTTPVIMLSAVNALADTAFSKESLGEFFGSAPSAFIEKPIDAEVLRQQVAAALDEHAGPAGTGDASAAPADG